MRREGRNDLGLCAMTGQDAKAGESPAPGTPPREETIGVVLRPEELADLDAWIAMRSHRMGRAEALRELALAKAHIDLDTGD